MLSPQSVEKSPVYTGLFCIWYNYRRKDCKAKRKPHTNGAFQRRKICTGGASTEEKRQCGRLKIDPVVIFKMALVQHLYGLPSLRKTYVQVVFGVFDAPLFKHRYTEKTIEEIFYWILSEIIRRRNTY